jgi:hypothetical protein
MLILGEAEFLLVIKLLAGLKGLKSNQDIMMKLLQFDQIKLNYLNLYRTLPGSMKEHGLQFRILSDKSVRVQL